MKVLGVDSPVSLVIDDAHWPYQVLTVNGRANVELLADSFPEYAAMATRYLGAEGGAAFMQARHDTFGSVGWARITIDPQQARL